MSASSPKSRSASKPARWVDDFDEQLWPINLTLLVLAGFAAGVIVGNGDFTTPEGAQAVYWKLGTLGGIVAITALFMAKLAPRQQRRVQLAALISLLMHLSVSLVMQRVYMVSTVEHPAPVEANTPQPVTLPEYHETPGETQEKLFTKLVDIKLPQEVREELERLSSTPVPVKRPTPIEPKQQPKLDPQPIELAKNEVADPRRAEKMQLPERQEPQVRQPEPDMQVTAPQPRQTQAQPTQQQPQVQVTKTQNLPQTPERKPTIEPPDRPAPTQPQQTAKAAQERQPQLNPQVASAQRTVRETIAPPPRVEQPAALATRNPDPQSLQSQVRDVVRGAIAAPQMTPQAPHTNQPLVALPQVNAPGKSDARPQVDQLAKLDTARSLKDSLPLPSNVNVPSAAAGAARGAQAANPQPAATQTAKVVNNLPQSAAAAGSSSSVATTSPGVSVGQPAATRAEMATASNSPLSTQTLARSDTSRTTTSGVDAAAIPATSTTNPDTAGSRNPASVEVSGVANVGRLSTRAMTGQPNQAENAAGTSAGPVTVATIVTGRPGSASDTPSLSPGSAGSGAAMGRSASQAGPVIGTQVANLPGVSNAGGLAGKGASAGGSGSGAGGSGAGPLNPALSGATQRGTGAGQPSLVGLSAGAAPGGGNDPTASGATGQATGLPANIGPRGDTVGGSMAPSVDVAGTGATLGRSTRSGGTVDVPGSSAVNVPLAGTGSQPNVTTPGRSATAGGPLASLGPATTSVEKMSDRPGVPVSLPSGVAGTGPAPTIELGTPLQRATRDSDVVATATTRLPLERTGGSPAIDGRVRDVAVEGLKQRDREGRAAIAQKLGGNADTEQAVELGLDFLARHQAADGSWSFNAFARGRNYTGAGEGRMESDTAATGLALLSFLGAGYTHTDGKYRAVVERGVDYLVSRQKSNGDLFQHADNEPQVLWFYSHGMASIALCEAYGMTRDQQLQQPAQQALRFILQSQNPAEGGWRYGPRLGSDTSVSGWQLMALKSGELARLEVPRGSYQLVSKWLDHAQGAGGDPSRYAYRPNSEQRDQQEPSHVMTAEALLMRQYTGWRRDNPNMVAGADWLRELSPRFGVPTSRRPYGERDAYFWYYATQVMFQMQGKHWEDWNGPLRSLLVDTQIRDGGLRNSGLRGSWDPQRPVPDRWAEEGGRIYVTCLHLLMLEVYYRHLPIYQTLEEVK